MKYHPLPVALLAACGPAFTTLAAMVPDAGDPTDGGVEEHVELSDAPDRADAQFSDVGVESPEASPEGAPPDVYDGCTATPPLAYVKKTLRICGATQEAMSSPGVTLFCSPADMLIHGVGRVFPCAETACADATAWFTAHQCPVAGCVFDPDLGPIVQCM